MIKHFLKTLAFILGGGIIILLSLYLILQKTPLLRDGVNTWIKRKNFPFKVKVEKIKGNFFTEVKLEGIKGEVDLPGYSSSSLEIKEIRFKYKLIDLLRGKKIGVKEVSLKEPRIILKEGRKTSSSPAPPAFPLVLIQRFFIDNGELKIVTAHGDLSFIGINLNLPFISLSGNRIEGELEDLSFDLLERDFHLKSLRGKFSFSNDSLFLSNITLITGHSNLLADGWITKLKNPEFTLSISGNKLNLNEMDKLANLGGILSGTVITDFNARGKLGDFRGKAKVDGIFLGRKMEDFSFEYRWKENVLYLHNANGIYFRALMKGDGWLNFSTSPPTYFADLGLFGLDIDEVVNSPLTTDLSGNVKLEGKGLCVDDLAFDFQVDLRESKIQGIPIDTIRGKIFIDRNGMVFLPGFQAYLEGASAQWEGDIDFWGGINISGEIRAADLSSLEEIWLPHGWGGEPSAHFTLQGWIRDPHLRADLLIDSLSNDLFTVRRLRGEIDLSGIFSRREGKAWLKGDSIEVKGLKWKRGAAQLRFVGDSIDFDSLWVKGGESEFSLIGSLQREGGKDALQIKRLRGQYKGVNFFSEKPFKVFLLQDMVSFGEINLQTEEGTILCSGLWGKEGLNLSLRVDDLRPVSIWGSLLPQLDGLLTASLDLSVRSNQLSLSGKFEIKRGRWGKLEFQSLSSPICYKDSLLTLEGLEWRMKGGSYELSASIPFYISLQPPGVGLLDKRLNLNIKGKGKRFDLPLLWTDLVQKCKGDFLLWGKAEGPPNKLKLGGGLNIKSGELKVKGIENILTGLNLDLSLKQNILSINRMEIQSVGRKKGRGIFYQLWGALSGRGKEEVGHLRISGNIDLSKLTLPNFNLGIEVNRLSILLAEGMGECNLDGSLQLIGQRPPLLQGRILVHKLVYHLPLSWSLPQGKRELPLTLDLDLSFPQNLWIKNPQTSVELAGDLRVSSVRKELQVLGDLNLKRGEYFLYGSTFHISSGLISFEESPDFNPRVEIEGKTEVGDETILLTVKGTLKQPIISFDSVPHHYPQEDILALLAVHQTPVGIDTLGAKGTIAPRATDFFTSYLEHELEKEIAKSLQVETLQIKADREKELALGKIEITVGKYISNRVYLQYSRRLSMESGQEVGIDYRLSRLFSLQGVRDRKGLYRLSLNLKWTY